MPTPPRKGESREAFLSRCHSSTAGEFKDPKQRHAVCINYWRDHLKKTTSERLNILADNIIKFLNR